MFQLLPALDNPKGEAQYLFTEKCLVRIIEMIKGLNPTKVLCVGAPRIHEQLKKDKSVKSLLLDIDRRYVSYC